MALQGQPQPPEQHGHVGALGPVVGVELVQDDVLERVGAQPPQLLVVVAQQELIEHLVVGEQDVRWRLAKDGSRGDQAVRSHLRALRDLLAGVEPGGNASQRVRPVCGVGDEPGQAQRLIVRQRVHRIEDQRLHPGLRKLGVAFDAQHVIEDREEETLGLARTRAGGDQRGGRANAGPSRLGAAQPGERLGLVTVRDEAGGKTFKKGRRLGRSGRERQPGAHVGALEDAVGGIDQEVPERALGIGVGEREGRGQVVQQASLQVGRLTARQQLAHDRSFSRRSNSAYAVRMSSSRSNVRNGSS